MRGFFFCYGKPLQEIDVSHLKERIQHAGRIKVRRVQQLALSGKSLRIFNSVGEAAKTVGASSCSSITYACRNSKYTCKGFRWRYIDE